MVLINIATVTLLSGGRFFYNISLGENLMTLGLLSSLGSFFVDELGVVMRQARRKRAVRDLSMKVFITVPIRIVGRIGNWSGVIVRFGLG